MDEKQGNLKDPTMATYQSQNHHVVQKTGRVFDTEMREKIKLEGNNIIMDKV